MMTITTTRAFNMPMQYKYCGNTTLHTYPNQLMTTSLYILLLAIYLHTSIQLSRAIYIQFLLKPYHLL